MKLSKEDLLKKVSEKVTDEDVSIELLEDITDSFEATPEVDNTELEETKAKLEAITKKYKDRFIGNSEVANEESKEATPEKKVEDEDTEEVKDIFIKKEEDE